MLPFPSGNAENKTRKTTRFSKGTIWKEALIAAQSALARHKATIIAGVILAMMAIVFAIAMQTQAQAQDAAGGLQVVVHDGQGRDHVFALDDEGSHVICTDQGENVILIENGSVRMEHADCPSGDCMRQAPLTKPGQQLICLPHKLWVELVPVGEAGVSELDTNAVVWIDGEATRDAGIDTVSR